MAEPTPVERYLKLTEPGEKAHEQRVTRYNRAYNTYRALPDKNADRIPAWRSKTRVPYAQQVIDTALVNIVSGAPRCLVHPRHPEDERPARAMQHLQDYFTAEDHLVEEQVRFAHQGLVYGVTVAKVHWLLRETPKKIRTPVQDPATGEIEIKTVVRNVVTDDRPHFETWNVYDAWWDPNARSVDSASYFVLRSYMTRKQLEAERYDPETDTGLYRNLDELFQTGPGKQPDQSAQEQLLGNADQKRKGAFEILEVWTDDGLCVIGNRQVLLREIPNPYWHNRKPIVVAQTRPDMFEMQGIPETDLLSDIQAALWTLQNMILDATHLTVKRGVTYREGSVVDPNMIDLKPGFKIGVTDHDDLRAFEVPQLGSDVFAMVDKLLGDMERVTGISAYLSGADSSTVNQTTATGVTALQGAANTLLRFKASRIHDAFQRAYELMGEMIQQFLTDPVYVKLSGEEPPDDWETFTPQDVRSSLSFRYRLEGSEEAITRQQEQAQAVGLLNSVAPFAQMQPPQVNAWPLIERVLFAFGMVDPEAAKPKPVPQLPPAAPTNGNGQIPGAPPQLGLPNGTPMPLQVQQAISG